MYYKKEVVVDGSVIGKPGIEIELSVEISDLNRAPDCKIGHFGYNFWIRTPYGVKAKVYKTDKTMERAVEKVLRNKGFKVVKWIERE